MNKWDERASESFKRFALEEECREEMKERGRRYYRRAQVEAFIFWLTVLVVTVSVVIVAGELSGFTSKVLGTF